MDILQNPAVIGIFIFFALLALNFLVFVAVGQAGGPPWRCSTPVR